MDKKKEFKKNSESHHFVDKLLTKFKMGKHGSDEKGSGSGRKLKNESTSKESVPFFTWEKNKISPDNIMEFSEQLHQLLEDVQNLKDVVFYTYKYPNILNQKLEQEAIELRNLFRDVRAAAIDIDRLKKQKNIIKKEKRLASKKLDKLKEDEIKELETIISVYAKPLYSKWEAVKNTQKADVLENFLNEVTGKHRAIEILQELIKRKLCKVFKKNTTMPFVIKKNISSTNVNGKIKTQDKNHWNITPFLDVEKFSQNIDKVVLRGTQDRDILRINKRKRQKELREERRRQNAESNNTVGSSTNSGSLDLQLVPLESFASEEIEDMKSTTRPSPIINIEYTSDDDTVSMSSSEFMIENCLTAGNTEIRTDLQHEMRSVLQALFGEIRHLPQIGNFTPRNRNNNSGNDLRSPRTASH